MPVRCLAVLLAAALPPAADAARLAGAQPKPEELVLVQKGTVPVIICAPHGGNRPVPGVAERTDTTIAQFATVRDEFTDRLAELLAAELEKKLGGRPWVVVARFDRKYIDANRPFELAFEADAAKPYYAAYHDPLAAACRAVRARHGRGLLLDLHGQGQDANTIFRGTRNGKTVTLLVDRYGWAAVTGKNGVLGRLERDGYVVFPKCDAPPETREEPKFNGGHTVGTYGSNTAFGIDAIQLEFGLHYRSREAAPKTARDLAAAVAAFHDAYLTDK